MMLKILYQDEDCVAINKPAGMLVHRSWLDRHETQFVMQTLRDQLGRHVYPVHRLDRPTSGVLLFALSEKAARFFAMQFEQHQVHKYYLAVVRGYVVDVDKQLAKGQIDYALKVKRDKIADKFSSTDKPDEPAITDYECLAITEMPFVACARYATARYSLVGLMPRTGRKHQLRRHMTHIFHPIVGDTTYGDTAQNKAVLTHTGVGRLLLHAYRLTFTSVAGQYVSVVAPLDEAFGKVVNDFGWVDVVDSSLGCISN